MPRLCLVDPKLSKLCVYDFGHPKLSELCVYLNGVLRQVLETFRCLETRKTSGSLGSIIFRNLKFRGLWFREEMRGF